MLSVDDVRIRLKRACQEAGSETAWAIEHGLSQAYVNKVVRGEKPPGPSILAILKLKAGYAELQDAE